MSLVEEVAAKIRSMQGVRDVDVGDGKILVHVDREYLASIVAKIYWSLGGYLSSMIATDDRGIDGHYKVYYVLSIEEGIEDIRGKPWVIVYTLIPWDDPCYPSVTREVPAASWYEREARDLLGLEPKGHPDPRRLVLPDDWPEGVYPLRKDFKYSSRPRAQPQPYRFMPAEVSNGITQIPLSPVHPVADEPSQFRLYVDGEVVVDVDYRFSYVHRGIEKLAEERFTYNQVPFLAERICGICGYAHSCAYCQAVEEALGIEVPERAEYIRSVMLEVERIHSHLLNLGILCHLVAFDWGFMELFRVREKAMKIAEILSGARKTYGMNIIGGVRRDVTRDRLLKAMSVLKELRRDYSKVINVVLDNGILRRRCEGVGVLPPKVARALSPVGPTARGSGLRRDTRYDHPYAAYKYYGVKPVVESGCDVYSRIMVRAREIIDSIDLIEHMLDSLPQGPVMFQGRVELGDYVRGLGYVEAPRGENVHFVILKRDSRVHRWRVRASTYNNWPVLPFMARGYTLQDFPVILASIDPCYSCTERILIVDTRSNSVRETTYSRLIHLSRKATFLKSGV